MLLAFHKVLYMQQDGENGTNIRHSMCFKLIPSLTRPMCGWTWTRVLGNSISTPPPTPPQVHSPVNKYMMTLLWKLLIHNSIFIIINIIYPLPVYSIVYSLSSHPGFGGRVGSGGGEEREGGRSSAGTGETKSKHQPYQPSWIGKEQIHF